MHKLPTHPSKQCRQFWPFLARFQHPLPLWTAWTRIPTLDFKLRHSGRNADVGRQRAHVSIRRAPGRGGLNWAQLHSLLRCVFSVRKCSTPAAGAASPSASLRHGGSLPALPANTHEDGRGAVRLRWRGGAGVSASSRTTQPLRSSTQSPSFPLSAACFHYVTSIM